MSTIMESEECPVLEKRSNTSPCQSLFAGLGESKRGPEATKDEEASGVEKEDKGDGEEMKEANGGVVVYDLFEYLQSCNELLKKILKEEEANGGGEKKEEGVVEEEFNCTICKKRGHAHYGCPWLKKLPTGPVPDDIPSDWMVECTYCHGLNFDKTGCCAGCEREIKKVVEKICPICQQTGHLDNTDEECLIFGLEDTPENDPFREFYES